MGVQGGLKWLAKGQTTSASRDTRRARVSYSAPMSREASVAAVDKPLSGSDDGNSKTHEANTPIAEDLNDAAVLVVAIVILGLR